MYRHQWIKELCLTQVDNSDRTDAVKLKQKGVLVMHSVVHLGFSSLILAMLD